MVHTIGLGKGVKIKENYICTQNMTMYSSRNDPHSPRGNFCCPKGGGVKKLYLGGGMDIFFWNDPI
jgi:hypothetical protein